MEDHRFSYSDPYETPFSPGFFNITNPTLADLSINNGPTPPTALPQQNHHHHEVLQQGQSSNNQPFLDSLVQDHHQFVHNNFSFGGSLNFEAGPSHSQLHGNQNQPSNGFSSQMHGNQIQPANDQFPSQMHGNEFQSANGFPSQMQLNQNQPANGFPSQIMHGDQIQPANGFPSPMDVNQNQPANGNPGLLNNYNFDLLTLEYWPPTPAQFFCSCCLVLREVIHTNGIQFEKLEIHGRLGFISHAIHNLKNINGDPPMYQMIDFSRRSLEDIKNFLANYCVERTLAGYFILQDPMSAYYETICTGMDWIDDINMEEPGDNQNNSDDVVEQVGENGTPTKDKNLAEKRKKAGKMILSDLRDYFHLPIEETAKQVDLCPTVIKKICRKAGLARWPHRKVKSLLKQISLLAGSLNSGDAAARARSEAEINRLKQEMIRHCGDIVPTAMYNIIPA